jgi:PLP dependent protein
MVFVGYLLPAISLFMLSFFGSLIQGSRKVILSHQFPKTFSQSLKANMASFTSASEISSETSVALTESGIPVVVENMNMVVERIRNASLAAGRSANDVRLVAVSKTKPVSDILALYNAGQRHFGENYYQEITEKAEELPKDIHWHFIGHLQSSKASKLIRQIPHIYVIETVDTFKLASKLQNACELIKRTEKLNIFIQMDTSGEDTKSGIDLIELPNLVDYILKECPILKIQGVMTIGAPDDKSCFEKLMIARNELATLLECPIETLELSMGMSGDFEDAITYGATSVRIGSTIFGARLYPNKETIASTESETNTAVNTVTAGEAIEQSATELK